MKKILALSLLAVSTVNAAELAKTIPGVVQLQSPYNATIEQVQKIYVPDGGVTVIDIAGQDQFFTYTEHMNSLQVDIKSSDRIVAIRSTIDDGKMQYLSIETFFGRSISVNIIGVSADVKTDAIKPKLLISSSSC
jgi:hypothetical protein